MNIITKQLVFSSLSRNSETSFYYAANSGRECLKHYLDQDAFIDYDPTAPIPNTLKFGDITIDCFGVDRSAEFVFKKLPGPFPGTYKYESGVLPVNIGGKDLFIGLSVVINLDRLNGSNKVMSGTLEKFNYLAIADGYNQDPLTGGSRLTKRSMIFAW